MTIKEFFHGYHTHYGSWWMVQWCFDGWFSLGVHVDWRTRKIPIHNISYGPYVDFHIGVFIVSIGNNPRYSDEIDIGHIGRGGVRVNGNSN